jgi:hypothetical protein
VKSARNTQLNLTKLEGIVTAEWLCFANSGHLEKGGRKLAD